MRIPSTTDRVKKWLGAAAVLLSLQPSFALAQETITLAIFQFRPENIDAMEVKSDVMLTIRNEISNRPEVRLLAKRDMEDILSRRGIDQAYSVDTATRAGQELSVRFVLIGSVIKQGAQIDAEMKLISVSSGREVGYWNTAYRSRNEISKTAADLSEQILLAMRQGDSEQKFEHLPAAADEQFDPVVVLVAEAAEDGISLTWEGVIGRDYLGYNIYRSESASGPYGFLDDVDGTYFSDKTAVPGITYYYQVGEVDYEGQEHRSQVIASASAITAPQQTLASDNPAPPLVYGLSEVKGGASLEFVPALTGANAGLASFRIYRASDTEDWAQIGEVQVESAEGSGGTQVRYKFVDRSLSPGIDRFSYSVSAVNDRGIESQLSEGFDFSPSNLHAAPVTNESPLLSEQQSNVQLEWQAADIDTGGVAPAVDPVAPTASADGAKTPIGSAIVSELVPVGLMAADQKLLREGRLLWSPAEVGEGYRIYRKNAENTWVRVGEIAGLLSTLYSDRAGLEDGRAYEYSYSVYEGDAESAKSQSVTITTKDIPPAPGNFNAVSGLPKRVELSWEAVDDVDIVGYSVYRADFTDTDKKFNVEFLDDVAGADTVTYVDVGSELFPIRDGGRYFYAVAARNSYDAVGKLSPAVRAQTKPAPRRVDMVEVAREEGRVVISWDYQSEDVARFLVSRRLAGQSWTALGNVDGTDRKYVDIAPQQAIPADYRVVVMDSTGLTSEPTDVSQ